MSKLPATEKQITAIENMTRALGGDTTKIDSSLSVSEASEKINELQSLIQNNIAISGYINPSRSYQISREEDADFGSAMGLDW